MAKTVIQHVLLRLHDIGIRDIFGVAGDYAFPIGDAVCADRNFRWIGNCNELNAAYSADGYARIRGMAAVSTTYAVGELSALTALAAPTPNSCLCFILLECPRAAFRLRTASCITLSAMASSTCFTKWPNRSFARGQL